MSLPVVAEDGAATGNGDVSPMIDPIPDPTPSVPTEPAKIWTDKADYFFFEIVTIYGTGFTPDASVTVTLSTPTAFVKEWTVVADGSGAFQTQYFEGLGEPDYIVSATDGTITASTTFTDGTQTTLDPLPSNMQTGITYSFSGRVTPTGGTGPVVAGQTVQLHVDTNNCKSSSGMTLTATALTDADGYFSGSFTAPTSGPWSFGARYIGVPDSKSDCQDGTVTNLCDGHAAGYECRQAAGDCDIAAECTGTPLYCPANGFEPAGTACGGSADACDALDTCNGAGTCVDNIDPVNTVCLTGTGTCDPDDICDGSAKTCTPVFATSGTACGGSDAACDALDTCNGSGTCIDNIDPAGFECRADAGDCDVADTCDGTTKACVNVFEDPGTTCDSGVGMCDDQGSCQDVPSGVTDSSLCPLPGDDFKLIFTPDMSASAYKMMASNPGQFYYNTLIEHQGTGSTRPVTISLPYPFVTQGAVPAHVYSTVEVNTKDCYVTGTEVKNFNKVVTIDPTAACAFGTPSPYTIDVPNPELGKSYYLNIHLDYGLKKTTPYTNSYNDAVRTSCTIEDQTDYVFSDDARPGDSDTITNTNTFKKNPGIGGMMLTKSSDSPVKNIPIQIFSGTDTSSKGKILGTMTTDEDGWAFYAYKWTGKAATFTLKPQYTGIPVQTLTLKANGFVWTTFQVPI